MLYLKVSRRGGVQPSNSIEQQESPHFYFKIPYIGRFSAITQHRVRKLVIRFCKPIDIKLVFCLLRDSLSDGLCTHVVYKFSCANLILVTSVKQAVIFLRVYTSTYHRTDLPMYSSMHFRIQSLVVPPAWQIVSKS